MILHGKVRRAMQWDLARLLNPDLRHNYTYFAAVDERAAAYMMSVFYDELNVARGW